MNFGEKGEKMILNVIISILSLIILCIPVAIFISLLKYIIMG